MQHEFNTWKALWTQAAGAAPVSSQERGTHRRRRRGVDEAVSTPGRLHKRVMAGQRRGQLACDVDVVRGEEE